MSINKKKSNIKIKPTILFDEVEPEDLDSNYFYEYLKENKEHIKDVINSKIDLDDEDDDEDLIQSKINVINRMKKKRKLNSNNKLIDSLKKTKIKNCVDDENINDSVDELSSNLEKLDVSKQYITILFYYEILLETDEKDIINTCSLNMFIGKDNTIKSYNNYINYKTINEKYIQKIFDFTYSDKYEFRIIILNKKLNIKSELNHWYEAITTFDSSFKNIFKCIYSDYTGINQGYFNEKINISKSIDKLNILEIIVNHLSKQKKFK